MKKFSVLLVILLLATPLLAYGLTADYDEGGIPLQTVFYSREAKEVNEAPPAFVADEQGEPGDEEIPPMEDPFFPEPDGFKGTVKDIDYDHNKITISEVHYFNNYTQTYEFAESYTILFNQYTDFVIDGESGRTINDIITGEPVTAIGEADYEKKTVTSTATVFQGSIYANTDEEPLLIPFSGEVKAIDLENMQMTVFCFELAQEITVILTEETCYQKYEVDNTGERICMIIEVDENTIPAEITTEAICDFVGLMKHDTHEATIHSVIIVESN